MTPASNAPAAPAAAAEPAAAEFRIPPDPPRVASPVVGRLVRCEPGGGAVVDFPGNPFGRPVAARTTTPLEPTAVGSEAVLLFEDGDPARPIVVGVIRPAGPRAGVGVELDGERVVLSAEREIVLRCGEASITLTRAGKVLIRGTYVLTRSSGANRIKGAAVEIN